MQAGMSTTGSAGQLTSEFISSLPASNYYMVLTDEVVMAFPLKINNFLKNCNESPPAVLVPILIV